MVAACQSRQWRRKLTTNTAKNSLTLVTSEPTSVLMSEAVKALSQLTPTQQKDALARAQRVNKKNARVAATKAAAKYGYTLRDLVAEPTKKPKVAQPAKSKAKKPAKAKYRNPKSATQTWTGKGRRPTWYKDAIANGTCAAAMEIKSSK